MITSEQQPITATPWGKPQHVTQYRYGISFVSTASHGGFYLPVERQDEIARELPEWTTFTGNPAWYEEDCDACLIPLMWPECFDSGMVARALDQVRGMAKRYVKWAYVIQKLDLAT